MTTQAVRVVGFVGAASPVPPEALKAIAEADLVVGGRRHLDALDVPEDKRLVLGPVDPAIETLRGRGEARAVVIASADPGFFGIVRRLRAAGIDLVVEPTPSAAALAFGRLGLPWEDAQVVSAHGRDLRRALNVVRAHDLVAVLTTVGAGLREIAAGCWAWPRRFALVEDIGGPRERLRWFTVEEALRIDPADIAEPNVVIAVADAERAPFAGPGMPWRLGDRGPHLDAHSLRDDVLSALVMGAFGLQTGELLAVAGEGLALVAAAAQERGAAVLRLDAGPRPVVCTTPFGELPTVREPDALCVSVVGGALPDVEIVPGTGTHPLRHIAVVADDMSLVRAEAALRLLTPRFRCRRLVLPVPERLDDVSHRHPDRHLLLATWTP